jgi:hypothetical protein
MGYGLAHHTKKNLFVLNKLIIVILQDVTVRQVPVVVVLQQRSHTACPEFKNGSSSGISSVSFFQIVLFFFSLNKSAKKNQFRL